MKKTVLLLILAVITNLGFLHAQDTMLETKKGKVGFNFVVDGDPVIYESPSLDGGGAYIGESYYSIGLMYIHTLNSWLEFETVIDYSNYDITIYPAAMPGMNIPPSKKNFGVVSIPLVLRANFWRFFYVNGGAFLGIDASLDSPISSQTGVGVMLGLGLKYDFSGGVSVFANPYFKGHSLFHFSDFERHKQLLEGGIRFGITYKLFGETH